MTKQVHIDVKTVSKDISFHGWYKGEADADMTAYLLAKAAPGSEHIHSWKRYYSRMKCQECKVVIDRNKWLKGES